MNSVTDGLPAEGLFFAVSLTVQRWMLVARARRITPA
jgi:hypothetical protein